ncbi:MAG: hypothetical protein J4F98_10205 [Acidobacteria bacterium]|nr:hypothetical protein [Acidobacteriota bacterium]
MALVAYDGRDLTLITDWTSSPDRIEDAVRQARRRKARGHLYAYGMGPGRGEKTRRSVMAAAGTLRSFANAPGRKVMLLLIEGWATVSDSFDFRSSFAAASSGVTLDRLYGPLVNAANLVGYSLYPIDLPGLRGRDLRISGFGTVGAVPPFAGPIGGYAMWMGSPEGRFHDVLRFLADETGGLPMINSFSNKALAETVEDTRSYYWLGFEPPRGENDRLHDIRVRLPGHRDLRVRTRENYLDMSRATEVSTLVEGALLLGGSPGTESLEVSFGTPRKAGFRKGDGTSRRRGAAPGERPVDERAGVPDAADGQVRGDGGAAGHGAQGRHPQRADAGRPLRLRDGSADPQAQAPVCSGGLRPAHRRTPVVERRGS